MNIPSKLNVRKTLILLLAIGLTVTGLLATENGNFRTFFEKIGVYPLPDKYTALFFNDSEKLSAEYIDSGLSEFTFGISNLEGKDINYNYVVEVLTGDTSYLVDRGSITVNSGETVLKTVEINGSKYKKGSLVYVTLPLNNRTIDFQIQ